jgi:hypothetical protein
MLARKRPPDGAAGLLGDEMRALNGEVLHHPQKVIRPAIDRMDARARAARVKQAVERERKKNLYVLTALARLNRSAPPLHETWRKSRCALQAHPPTTRRLRSPGSKLARAYHLS